MIVNNVTMVSGGNTDMEDALIMKTLTEYSNDRVESIGNYTFYDVGTLTSVDFLNATSIGGYAFYSCSSLTNASFPEVTSIGNSAFRACFSLTNASFPEVTSIGSNAFCFCYNLKSLTLGASTVCALSNSVAFSSTPIGGYSTSAGAYGSIYVPASLLASYQAATNWSYYSSRFVGI